MRLSFHVEGDSVVATIEVGTLSYKRTLPYEPQRIRQLSSEVVDVLARGNRAHTLTGSNLRNLRQIGEQLAQQLVHPDIASRLPEADQTVLLQLDELLVTVPWELLHGGDRFWCHRFDLGRVVTTPQRIATSTVPPAAVGPLRMLVICADPRGDLPRVISEGETLIERLDASTSIDARLVVDPTVEAVRRRELLESALGNASDPARQSSGIEVSTECGHLLN